MKKRKSLLCNKRTAAVVRMRHVVFLIAALTAAVSAPLWIVWKEAYATRMALELRACADTLATLRHHAEKLRFVVRDLSQHSRIETIARDRLGLEYPSPSQIVIVPWPKQTRWSAEGGRKFLAML